MRLSSLLGWHKFPLKLIQEKTSARQFLILSSILVGLTAGLAAVLLKELVYYIHLLIKYNYKFEYHYYLYLIFPLIGILLTVLYVQRIRHGKLEKGNATILYSVKKKSSLIPKHHTYSHLFTSALTVGFGGSAGLESPIVSTGAAIGSNYAKAYDLSIYDRTLLLASGVAAGIGAVFNAPIAGVLFALEVLLKGKDVHAFIPILIAAATGTLTSKIILNEDILLSFHLQQRFNYLNTPYYILLGILAGLLSAYYAKVFIKIEGFYSKYKHRVWLSALSGGIFLAILIFFFPPLFGEGYESIKILSNQMPEKLIENGIFSSLCSSSWFILFFIGSITFLKVIATSITINSGGNGGNFAPSLFVGAYLGYFFAYLVRLLKIANLPLNNFTIVGMSGILSGIFYAPLTAIFLIAEITGGYELIIPLIIVSVSSYIVAKYFNPISMDEKHLTMILKDEANH